jgi:ATP-dependent Lhr-like helicase
MDVAGLEQLLARMEQGEVRVLACELTEPSPLALEILSARPYAFLDDAPLEERRTQAVMARRWIDAGTAADLGKLDADAIGRVREEVWPEPRNADELADALTTLAFLSDEELAPAWGALAGELAEAKRATRVACGDPGRAIGIWVAAERLPEFDVVLPVAVRTP